MSNGKTNMSTALGRTSWGKLENKDIKSLGYPAGIGDIVGLHLNSTFCVLRPSPDKLCG